MRAIELHARVARLTEDIIAFHEVPRSRLDPAITLATGEALRTLVALRALLALTAREIDESTSATRV